MAPGVKAGFAIRHPRSEFGVSVVDDYPVAGARWTEAEVEYLRANYRGNPIEVSVAMGRSPKAITLKAEALGLQSRRVPAPKPRPKAEIFAEQERRAQHYIACINGGMRVVDVAAADNVTVNAVRGILWRYRKRTGRRA